MLINYQKVKVYQGEHLVLQDIDFKVDEGELSTSLVRLGRASPRY